MKIKKWLVYFFLCLAKCGLRGFLIRNLVFYPPYPPTYTLRKKDKSCSVTYIKNIVETIIINPIGRNYNKLVKLI